MRLTLKRFSKTQLAWAILAASALGLELCALFFQHVLGLNPCVMCIYERIAVLGILFSGLIGLISPRLAILRVPMLISALASALYGISLSLQHTQYQLAPNPWDQCPIRVQFPDFLPLDEWLPFFFKATGLCSEINWHFVGFTMPQWLTFIFGCYALVLAALLVSQTKSSRRNLFHR